MKYKSKLGHKFDMRLKIEGEPGTGKTTIIREIQEICKVKGWGYGWSLSKPNELLLTIVKK